RGRAVRTAEELLRESETGPGPDQSGAAQVGKCKGLLAVAAVGRADQVEERVVFRNRHEPSVGERGAVRTEGARKNPELGDEGAAARSIRTWKDDARLHEHGERERGLDVRDC